MFEYKFVSIPVKNIVKSLLNPEYKMKYLETQWNALGKDDWEYCTTGYNCLIFKREVKDVHFPN